VVEFRVCGGGSCVTSGCLPWTSRVMVVSTFSVTKVKRKAPPPLLPPPSSPTPPPTHPVTTDPTPFQGFCLALVVNR